MQYNILYKYNTIQYTQIQYNHKHIKKRKHASAITLVDACRPLFGCVSQMFPAVFPVSILRHVLA